MIKIAVNLTALIGETSFHEFFNFNRKGFRAVAFAIKPEYFSPAGGLPFPGTIYDSC